MVFKLDDKTLTSVNTVKYLGIVLDEHLQKNKQLTHVQPKLNFGIGILSKFKHNTNLTTLKLYIIHVWRHIYNTVPKQNTGDSEQSTR